MNTTRFPCPPVRRRWPSARGAARKTSRLRCAVLFAAAAAASPVVASYQDVRVEQIIGSLNGDPAAQAIQLQTRATGGNLVSSASLWVADATGGNRRLLMNIPSNVSNGAVGSRILLTTAAFTTAVQAGTPSFAPDFTLTNPIPAGYLAAGRLTYEADGGTTAAPGIIYWSVSWGGAGYTGSNTGSIRNDPDGNFGPPYAQGLPTTGAQGIRLTSAVTVSSTSNAADYSLSPNPATVINNSGTPFVLPVPQMTLEMWRQNYFGTTENTGNAADAFDFDKDGLANLIEFAFGLNPTQNSAGLLPQPQNAGATMVTAFDQPAGITGITYTAEKSATLLPGSWTPIADTGAGSQHIFSVPVIPGEKMFVRLKVTNP